MITGRTRLYGIIADPILYVKTPEMMNALMAEMGHDGVIVPMHLKEANMAAFFEGIRRIDNLGGLIVTLPHKTRALSFCDRLEGDAQAIGAINTIRREADGSLVGRALDGEGFLGGLDAAGIEARGADTLLLGAGGAAAGVGFALAARGVARLTIHNRSRDKAEDLAARIRASYPSVAVDTGPCETGARDLIVNTTSLGMQPQDPLPLPDLTFRPGQVVAEAIMSPERTALLETAAQAGARIHPGRPMLHHQLRQMLAHWGVTAAEHHD